MFSSGLDSSKDTSGSIVSLLIPRRFVWPYGGRSVFLTGSFTRWSDHISMSPVEGCPTVFQTTYNLTPGFHQYKFCVDGEWRHDENQPYVFGNYGIVNTLLLTRDPDPVHIYSPVMAGSRTNMDVDNEHFRRVVTLSGGGMQEATMRISEADIEISRHRISVFLSSHTAYELLPESGKVIALDVNMAVKQAFHILYEQGIPVAPLWDFYKGQFVGVLSALDFILILREIGNHGSNLTEEELETHTISAWKEGKQQLYGQVDEHGRPFQRHLIHAGPYDSLKDVAIKILQNEVATIPIIHSSSHDASFPQLLHLASLSGILRCICRYFRHSSISLPILQQPVCTIPLGTWVPRIGESDGRPLAMLRPNASLSSALSLLVQARVSSIPIVDDSDSLLDTYSRSDITALAKDKAYAQIHLDEMSIHQEERLLCTLLCRHAKLSLLPNQQAADEELSTYYGQGVTRAVPSPFERFLEKHKRLRTALLLVVLFGASMVIGDGVLTPAISVLSSISSLQVRAQKLDNGYTVRWWNAGGNYENLRG